MFLESRSAMYVIWLTLRMSRERYAIPTSLTIPVPMLDLTLEKKTLANEFFCCLQAQLSHRKQILEEERVSQSWY